MAREWYRIPVHPSVNQSRDMVRGQWMRVLWPAVNLRHERAVVTMHVVHRAALAQERRRQAERDAAPRASRSVASQAGEAR